MTQLNIDKLVLKQIIIPFKARFNHTSAQRIITSSLLVEAISTDQITGYGESCPRPYVTNETLETAQAFFTRYQSELCQQIKSLASLRQWSAAHVNEINTNPAAWCAIELAILDLLGKQQNSPIERVLGLPKLKKKFQYSAVVGDSDISSLQTLIEKYLEYGFTDFKLKLSGDLEHDRAKLKILKKYDQVRIRVDANNLWTKRKKATSYLQALDTPLFAIEEPLQIDSYLALSSIAETLNCKIILDESFLRIDQLAWLNKNKEHWIINLRVSKMGGLLRSLAIIEQARISGLNLIVGAQVGETSLLTRAGISMAHAANDLLIAQEGAFGTYLLETDLFTPSLMFGMGGTLDKKNYPLLDQPGLGYSSISNPKLCTEMY